MREAYAHCEALVRAADKDRYLAALFLPAPVRPAAFAVIAFSLELSSIPPHAREPMAGEIRLQWWRDALTGEAEGAAANPVTAALIATIERQALPRESFERMVEARSFDLYDDPMPDGATLDSYLDATEGSLFAAIARMLMDGRPGDGGAVRAAGIAYGLTRLLRAFALHASRGRIFLPAEMLERHGASSEKILRGEYEPALAAALAEMRARVRDERAAARAAIAEWPSAAAAAFLPLALIEPYLRRMEATDFDPFRTPVEVPQWKRQWALWRAARRGV